MRTRKIDMILESEFIKNQTDLYHYRQLSESDKANLTKEMIDSLYAIVLNKTSGLDYDEVEASAGDITRMKGYATLEESIKTLNNLKMSSQVSTHELDVVNNALNNLKANKHNFEAAFRSGNAPIMLLYNNICVALISSVSFLIVTMVDYVKDPMGNYDAKLKNNYKAEHGYSTLFLKNLEYFNRMATSGDLAKFFEIGLSKQGFLGLGTSLSLGSLTLTVLGGLGLIVGILVSIREMVYQYFYMRVKISDMLAQQGQFIELNSRRLLTHKDTKSIGKKQEKIAKTLLKLSDKIDVEQKTATKKAEIQLKKENSTISLDNPQLTTNSNSSFGDIL